MTPPLKPPPYPPAALASPREAAAFLRVSPSQIFKLTHARKLTRIKLGERSTRIPWAELHRLAGVDHA